MNRLFFALMPSEDVRHACRAAARDLMIRTQCDGKPVPPDNYHATIVFLGSSVTKEQEAGARQAASLMRGAPFSLTLDVAGSFPRANVWWLGTRSAPEQLLAFRQELYQRISSLGLPLERSKFTPHVTVARSDKKLPPTMIKPIEWAVSDFVLMRSRLDKAPVTYDVIERWRLDGGQARHAEQISLF